LASIVALIKCGSYEPGSVYTALSRAVELLGGIAQFARPGEKILLKPNMLFGKDPGQAVTTHPAVFEAAVRLFQSAGARLSYGDSPGYGSPKQIAGKTGLKDIAEKYGVTPADFENHRITSYPEGKIHRSFPVAAGVLDAEGIVSLPKMKTHGLTRITGAVKNQLGCIVGFEKAKFHFQYPNVFHFSRMLADLNNLLRPRLYIMDGITAMEGEGPSGGDPVSMGVLLVSRDPVALDATFCRLVGLDPSYVPTVTEGEAAGLGLYNEKDIVILGDAPESCMNLNFDVKRIPAGNSATFHILRPFKDLLVPRPVILEPACKKCGICIEACPVPGKALAFEGGKRTAPPRFDYSRCIRCFCCHEMCPHKAIRIKTPVPGKILMGLLKKLS
jgi:uncharacterized protein (DUF362 family)/Pyruvate/2-oxoacid:ferredoxin oxidoreductase delta subunit